jgi:hypothetical protein
MSSQAIHGLEVLDPLLWVHLARFPPQNALARDTGS